MLNKDDIENLVEDANGDSNRAVEDQSDKNLIRTLEDLGYLPHNFQGGFLFNLLEHKNYKVT